VIRTTERKASNVLDIKVHGVTSPALIEHAEARISAALDQHEERVVSVNVKLEDINGRSKGQDKRCHVTVKFKREEPVIVDEVDDDMYAAVSNAADRVKNVVGRHHEKHMDKLHGKT
jgi:putative sigma-54 modulation protein